MGITLDIPDEQCRVLESKAALEGVSINDLLLQAVRAALSVEKPRRTRRLKVPLLNSGEPGSLVLDNERIYDILGFP